MEMLLMMVMVKMVLMMVMVKMVLKTLPPTPRTSWR
jgi:hypothetical protein